MDSREIRLRLIESAARNPVPHKDGFAAGVLEAAQKWELYVLGPEKISGEVESTPVKPGTLKLPKKPV